MVAGFCGALLAFNLFTGSNFPIVWWDEVLFTDPAANLLLGRGFTSSSWFGQSKTEFWAAYPPLYSILLYHWIQVFGFTPLGVRSLNYVIVIGAVLLIWCAVTRLRLLITPRYRILLLAILLLSYSSVFAYRSARPECLGMLIFSALLFSFARRDASARRLALAFFAVLLPLTGLQFVAYAGLLGVLLFCFLGRGILRELVYVAGGIAFGLVLLYCLYLVNGVWSDFVVLTAGVRSVFARYINPDQFAAGRLGEFRIFGGFYKDPSFLLLLVLALTLLVPRLFRRPPPLRSLLSFGTAAAFAVPAGLYLAGYYPTYYSWMAFVPLSICVCASLERSGGVPSGAMAPAVRGLLAGTCLAGLPLIFGVKAFNQGDYYQPAVERLAREHVSRQDSVFTEFVAYYPVKQTAAIVYLPSYLRIMSAGEKAGVTLLLVAPNRFAEVTDRIGGRWEAVGTPVVMPATRLPPLSIWSIRHNLQAYRRR